MLGGEDDAELWSISPQKKQEYRRYFADFCRRHRPQITVRSPPGGERFSRIRLALILSLSACTHIELPAPTTGPYAFPAQFYVEQTIDVSTPAGAHSLFAQLQRSRAALQLVLLERGMGLVLARVTLPTGAPPVVEYLSPQLAAQPLPLLEIAAAIRFLYEHTPITPAAGHYEARDPAGRWTYSWRQLRGGPSCAFPESLDLRFKDQRYRLRIALEHLECSP